MDNKKTNREINQKIFKITGGVFGVLLICFIIAIIVQISSSEKQKINMTVSNKQTIQENIEENTTRGVKETNQHTDSNIEPKIHGMTENENTYWNLAEPYVLEILKNNKSIIELYNSNQKEDNWHDNFISLAQKIIEDGNYLETLQYADDTKTIGDLVQLFGYNISRAYENYIEGITNSDTEKIELYQMDYKTAMCQLNEINFYSINGIEITKQLEEDVKRIVGNSFDSAGLTASGANFLFVRLNKELFENKEVLRNDCLLSVNDILEMLSKNPLYNYLDLTVKIDCNIVDDYGQKKELVVMEVELNSDTRNKLNFENFSFKSIPNIADSYKYFFD